MKTKIIGETLFSVKVKDYFTFTDFDHGHRLRYGEVQ